MFGCLVVSARKVGSLGSFCASIDFEPATDRMKRRIEESNKPERESGEWWKKVKFKVSAGEESKARSRVFWGETTHMNGGQGGETTGAGSAVPHTSYHFSASIVYRLHAICAQGLPPGTAKK